MNVNKVILDSFKGQWQFGESTYIVRHGVGSMSLEINLWNVLLNYEDARWAALWKSIDGMFKL